MCIDIDRKPYGFLFKNDLNEFVYSCSRCDEEFLVGRDLEYHTFGHDVKEESENQIFELPIEVLPLPTTLDYCKDEATQIDDTKTENAIYLPIEAPKSEVKTKQPDDEVDGEERGNDDDDFGFPEDSSSDEDYFTPTTVKKAAKAKQMKVKTPKKMELHCDICSKVLTSLARIQQHMEAVHINKKKKSERQWKLTLCTLCGKQVRYIKAHLRAKHTETSEPGPFKCDFCSATFKRKDRCTAHSKQHDDRPYICHSCGRIYNSKNSLYVHMKRQHLKDRPHKCEQCGKAYLLPFQLRDHINLHHLNQKMYPCTVCERRFGTRKHLQQHMLSHGEKRYKCKYCDQKFATTSGRRGHETRNHCVL